MTDMLNAEQFGAPQKAGLRGRNKPVVKFPLKWAHEYLIGGVDFINGLPVPTFPIDVTGGITDFGMMSNDLYGDCGPVGEVHIEMTTAAAAGVAGPTPTGPLAIMRYNKYDGDAPAPGPGVDLASYAKWLFDQGIILGWAPVDISNPSKALALMAVAGGLWIGVNLTPNNNDQFNNGQPFDLDGQQPDPEDGHCVVLSKAESFSGPFEVITWGKSWPCTLAWLRSCFFSNPNGEAFILLTTEEQLAHFEPALVADCRALGGTVKADPEPTVHPPIPNLPAPLPAFYEEWWDAVQKRERELEEWIKAHL